LQKRSRANNTLRASGFAALLFLALSGCSTTKSQPVAAGCGTDDWYFPRGTFPASYPSSDEARRRWYSLPYIRMQELSMSCGDWTGADAYRFLWLDTSSQPTSIRITRQDNRIWLLAIRLSGTGGGDPGFVSEVVRRELPAADWDRLTAAVAKAHFWALSTSGNMFGQHGEQWIIEGRQKADYHLVDRWGPNQADYRALGLLFFDIAGWSFPGIGSR